MNLFLLGFVAQIIIVYGVIVFSEYWAANPRVRDSKKDF